MYTDDLAIGDEMVPFKKNDIIGQTMAMIGLGASIGIFYAWTVTINIKSEENVYQRMLWPRWKVVPTDRLSYRFKEMGRCGMIMGVWFGTFAFVDAVVANVTKRDGWWNPFLGGLAAGFSGWCTRGKFTNNIILGTMFASLASGKRVGWNRLDEDKLQFSWDHKWGLRPRGCSWVLPDEGNTKEHPFRAGPHFRPGA